MKWRPGKILNTPEGLSISPSLHITANLGLFGFIVINFIFKEGQGNLSEFDNFVFLEAMFDISTFYKMH